MSTSYDVVISGGGMVGLVAALSLSQQFDRVLLIEKNEAPSTDLSDARALRVSAMAENHWHWFETLGMGRFFDAKRLGPYRHMSVWDNRSDAALDFSQPTGKKLGAIVENNHVVAAATSALQAQDKVTIRYQAALQSFEDVGRKVRLKLSGGEQIDTALLISAEGAHAPIRQAAQIAVKQSSYQQQGLVCYVQLDKAAEKTAYQAFNPTGPVGILPMGGGVFSIVWSLADDQLDRWLSCDEERFCHGLKAHINRDLGMPKLLSERVAFPLKKQQASAYVKGRVVLLGDAAHVVHPLAGQGVNLGLADAAFLSEQLSQVALKDSEAVDRALKKYQRVRRSKVAESQLMIDAVHHLFTKQNAPLPWLRATGMKWVNRLTPLKSWLMTQAGS